MIYELRLYSVVPGRMPDLHKRFERLPPLFKRHGVQCIGQWTVTAGPRMPGFVYLMAYADLAEREARWAPFYTDPDWLSLRAETNAGSEMVERYDLCFLKPNAGWAPDPSDAQRTIGGVHELLMHEAALGQGAATNAFLRDVQLPLLREQGAQVMLVADMASGPRMPQVVTMLGWADDAAREKGWAAVEADAGWRAAVAVQRDSIGWPVLGRTDRYVLRATESCLPKATLGGIQPV
ncbi:MAG: NIPSNAP family protein [Pseudomonadota bacterium]